MTETPRNPIVQQLRRNVSRGGPEYVRVVDQVEDGRDDSKGPDVAAGMGHVAFAVTGLLTLSEDLSLDRVRISDTPLQSVLPPREALPDWPLRPDHPAVAAQIRDIRMIAGVQVELPPYTTHPDGTFQSQTNISGIIYEEVRHAQPPIITVFAVREVHP